MVPRYDVEVVLKVLNHFQTFTGKDSNLVDPLGGFLLIFELLSEFGKLLLKICISSHGMID